jgi:hypothetical protein
MDGDATPAARGDHEVFPSSSGSVPSSGRRPCCIAKRLAAARVEHPIFA